MNKSTFPGMMYVTGLGRSSYYSSISYTRTEVFAEPLELDALGRPKSSRRTHLLEANTIVTVIAKGRCIETSSWSLCLFALNDGATDCGWIQNESLTSVDKINNEQVFVV